jgi:hypothetical protein
MGGVDVAGDGAQDARSSGGAWGWLAVQLVAMPAAVLVLVAIIVWARRRSVTRLIALIRHHTEG